MSLEGQPDLTAEEPAAAPPPDIAPTEGAPGEVSYSKLVETVSDPKLKAEAGRFASFNDVIGAWAKTREDMSDRIRLPGPKSTPEDIAKYNKAIGVPDNEEGYKVTAPTGISFDDDDAAIINALRPLAMKSHIPATAFAEFISSMSTMAHDMREALTKEIEGAHNSAVAELDKEWGQDKAKNVAMATRASAAHGGDRFVNFLNGMKLEGAGLLGDHPEMVRFLAKVGAKSDEADMIIQSSATEKQGAQARINEIHEKYPVGTPAYNRPEIQREIAELFKKVAGEGPIAGTAGRTT